MEAQDSANADRLLRLTEVAELFGCSRSYLYDLFEHGQLKSCHVGRMRRVALSEARRFLAERMATAV